jgi:hypothetical protein
MRFLFFAAAEYKLLLQRHQNTKSGRERLSTPELMQLHPRGLRIIILDAAYGWDKKVKK